MNNDGSFVSPGGNGASAQNRSFGPGTARETESVPRRMAGESLDEYLRNINSYLNDLNSRLGMLERSAGVQQDVPFAAPQEPAVPYAGQPGPAAPAPDVPAEGGLADTPPMGPEFPEGGFAYAASAAPDGFAAPDGEGSYREPPVDDPEDGAAAYREEAPYGIDFDAAQYAEPVSHEGYVRSDWQAAVPNPELYPDLDALAEKGTRGRKKEKQRRRKEARPPKMTRGGKSRFSFVTTVINIALYGGWSVLYFVCLAVRSMLFTGAQAEMASQGVAVYSVSISSPLFTVLKILIYAMPVVLLLWMRGVLSAEKKQLPQLDKKLLIAAFAADLLAGIIVIFDVLAARLIFG